MNSSPLDNFNRHNYIEAISSGRFVLHNRLAFFRLFNELLLDVQCKYNRDKLLLSNILIRVLQGFSSFGLRNLMS